MSPMLLMPPQQIVLAATDRPETFLEFIAYCTTFTSLFSPPLRYAFATLGGVLMLASLWLDDDSEQRWCLLGGLAVALFGVATVAVLAFPVVYVYVKGVRARRRTMAGFLSGDHSGNASTGEW